MQPLEIEIPERDVGKILAGEISIQFAFRLAVATGTDVEIWFDRSRIRAMFESLGITLVVDMIAIEPASGWKRYACGKSYLRVPSRNMLFIYPDRQSAMAASKRRIPKPTPRRPA